MRFAANLTTMFNEYPFMARFEAAAQAGFYGVEMLFPYQFKTSALSHALNANGLAQVLINAPAGNWYEGDRGLAAIPSRVAEFRDSVATGLRYAQALGCDKVHVMSGNARATPENLSTYADNIRYAAKQANSLGISITIEPINSQDMPDYFLDNYETAMDVVDAVSQPNLGIQLDIYHAQKIGGNLTTLFREIVEYINHVQIASVPCRNEPITGEVNYEYVLKYLEALGYEGWVGCEYVPRSGTLRGLDWRDNYLDKEAR